MTGSEGVFSRPHLARRWIKAGFIAKPQNVAPWWQTHAMAPTPIWDGADRVRIFVGGWDSAGISRIGRIDVSAADPSRVLSMTREPLVDLGRHGTFDDNGVFPGHVTRLTDGRVFLYYTGFQKSVYADVDHFNFSGLAISEDGGETFRKVSEVPVMDRADEGLHIRAGLSVREYTAGFASVYSAGTGFIHLGGKLRPIYEVFFQISPDGLSFGRSGRKIVAIDPAVEHGLGRPQIVRIDDTWYTFYTRRTLDMKYRIGCAWSKDLETWQRIDDWVDLGHGASGEFDSDMFYFPSVVQAGSSVYLVYCGNGYGRDGIGYAVLK